MYLNSNCDYFLFLCTDMKVTSSIDDVSASMNAAVAKVNGDVSQLTASISDIKGTIESLQQQVLIKKNGQH